MSTVGEQEIGRLASAIERGIRYSLHRTIEFLEKNVYVSIKEEYDPDNEMCEVPLRKVITVHTRYNYPDKPHPKREDSFEEPPIRDEDDD